MHILTRTLRLSMRPSRVIYKYRNKRKKMHQQCCLRKCYYTVIVLLIIILDSGILINPVLITIFPLFLPFFVVLVIPLISLSVRSYSFSILHAERMFENFVRKERILSYMYYYSYFLINNRINFNIKMGKLPVYRIRFENLYYSTHTFKCAFIISKMQSSGSG
jgi:hypothetical protein